jgi:hypothetical protein
MVANTPNGRVPHIGGGVALLPLGPGGEKWGVDDLLAEGYNWGDIQAFIYPMNQVFDLKTGKFSPAPGLLPPVSHSGFGTGGNHLPLLTVAEFFAQATESYECW